MLIVDTNKDSAQIIIIWLCVYCLCKQKKLEGKRGCLERQNLRLH
jgi:hypothetical protein